MSASFRVGGVLIENGNEISGNSLPTASTSSPGVVQLSDSTSSSSTAVAATANAVSVSYTTAAAAQSDATQAITAAATAQAVADAALPASGGVLTGPVTFPSEQVIPTTNIATASTSVPGVVQLNDTTSSTSTIEALTANQGKELQDQINALAITSNLTLAGTIDASTGLISTVTEAGTQHGGFVVGDPLPTADNQNNGYFAIVVVPGTMTPPGGSAQECHQGDWWLSDGASWEFLDVGFNATAATTSTPGVVQLATNAEVQGGTNLDRAVTPSGLQSKISDSTSTVSFTTLASSTAVKSAYDAGVQGQTAAAAAQATAGAALPKAGGTMTGNITFSDSGEGLVFSDASSIVGLSDSISSTSTTVAASSAAVKAAYDAAVSARSNGPLTSDTVLYVNCTDGNNTTAARGTDRPFATIAAALAAASEGDTIFLSAGTFTENFTISKGVHLCGTFSDQATWSGTKILGNVVVNLVGAGVIRNLAVSDIYFISANSTSPLSITGMSPGAGGINTFTNCAFTQQTVTDTAQFAFQTSGTWTRSVYLRDCTIDGNFKHNAGTAAGASGYIVIDALQGVGNSNMFHYILTGTVEYRNPSNTLASIYQTGGVALVNNAAAGITANAATTSAIFGGTGFSYKGTAAAAGAGTIYFQGGSNQGSGKVDIGANVIYGWTNLTIDPANLTVNGAAIAYTTAVPSAANAQSLTQQRPRLDLLKSTSSVAAANQLATVIDSATGAIYSVAAMDAGTY